METDKLSKRTVIIIAVLFMISGFTQLFAQPAAKPVFSSGDRVCFVGNSITNGGEFHHNILLYQITRFPNQEVNFYNCGISGDVTSGILNRMEDDILIHKPTHAVIMIGMNDVQRSLYGLKPTNNADTLRRREEAISRYEVNLEKIINLFISKNIKVILQKPSIYDQTVMVSTPNNFGVNDALKTCADFIETMSIKYKLQSVDYWSIMNQLNQEMQKKNPTATITGRDRVHPAATGHLVMAYQFLKTLGAPKYVSKICINKSAKKSSRESLNCEISKFSNQKGGLTFSVMENALPFPFISNQKEGLELVPFIKDLNVELIQVAGLKSGKYKLEIDKILIGEFSEAQLAEGVNLADYQQSPQYEQAMKVRRVLEELWKNEANLRGIKFIEYNGYFKTCPNKENLTAVKTYLDSVFTVKYDNPYYKARLADYIAIKPKEEEFKTQSDMLRKEALNLAKPAEHIYSIHK